MKPSMPLKIITLSGFILMITGFVLYRSGSFEGPAGSTETLQAALNSTAVDTPKTNTADSTVIMHDIMPSSKSGVIFREPVQVKPAPVDSTKKGPK